jgi:hypothetical protein
VSPDITNELLRALLTATDVQKQEALRVLKGEPTRSVKPPDPEPYLTLKEVARRLNVSACSLWRWRVPGHALGGRPRFRMGEVLAYLESDAFRKRAAELRLEDRARRMKPK